MVVIQPSSVNVEDEEFFNYIINQTSKDLSKTNKKMFQYDAKSPRWIQDLG